MTKVLERNVRRNIIADEKHEVWRNNKIIVKIIEFVSVFLKRSAWANGVFKTRNENYFSDCPNCDYEDSCSVGKEKLRNMFPPRQIFGVVFDHDGTRTIYKVNRFVDFLPTKSPAGYSGTRKKKVLNELECTSSFLRVILSEHFLVLHISHRAGERKQNIWIAARLIALFVVYTSTHNVISSLA